MTQWKMIITRRQMINLKIEISVPYRYFAIGIVD